MHNLAQPESIGTREVKLGMVAALLGDSGQLSLQEDIHGRHADRSCFASRPAAPEHALSYDRVLPIRVRRTTVCVARNQSTRRQADANAKRSVSRIPYISGQHGA